ncbi:hypothetical protein [Nocardia sp. NPDC049149]|uniref:hypothetical protein n=1 Tax=Nocardia sp. NPDC049149 TaxID=3364315 RepID=UPI0037140E52
MVTRTQLRRRLHKTARRLGLRRLALRLDPGPRIRLWDAEFNLKADSDRGDVIPLETLDADGIGSLVYEPATTVRWSGRLA